MSEQRWTAPETGRYEVITGRPPHRIADTERPRTDAAVGKYLTQNLLARQAHAVDPQYHQQTEMLRQLLAGADTAMELENIPLDIRDRVIHRLLYGSLNECAALERAADLEAKKQQLMQAPVRFRADPDQLLQPATSVEVTFDTTRSSSPGGTV